MLQAHVIPEQQQATVHASQGTGHSTSTHGCCPPHHTCDSFPGAAAAIGPHDKQVGFSWPIPRPATHTSTHHTFRPKNAFLQGTQCAGHTCSAMRSGKAAVLQVAETLLTLCRGHLRVLLLCCRCCSLGMPLTAAGAAAVRRVCNNRKTCLCAVSDAALAANRTQGPHCVLVAICWPAQGNELPSSGELCN